MPRRGFKLPEPAILTEDSQTTEQMCFTDGYIEAAKRKQSVTWVMVEVKMGYRPLALTRPHLAPSFPGLSYRATLGFVPVGFSLSSPFLSVLLTYQ